ncbi:hypothetical protein Ahy_A09g042654 [Arachis hypogaea]|uniref:BED-type domain-containing protein n=1 Tax=Arachis hypogaea TaxID=3818 RepID=A0A445BGH7_ARAHY|nr:hypothetical protein Ahy_A09g042654 [Arachis hypogaea]
MFGEADFGYVTMVSVLPFDFQSNPEGLWNGFEGDCDGAILGDECRRGVLSLSTPGLLRLRVCFRLLATRRVASHCSTISSLLVVYCRASLLTLQQPLVLPVHFLLPINLNLVFLYQILLYRMDSFSSTPVENNNEIEPTQDDEGQAIEAHVQGTQEVGQEETQEGGQEVSQSVQNSPNKKGLTSEAWKHFRREQIDGKWKAICKYCERKIGGDTKQGIKHLHDHIRICPIRTRIWRCLLEVINQIRLMEYLLDSIRCGVRLDMR